MLNESQIQDPFLCEVLDDSLLQFNYFPKDSRLFVALLIWN